MNLGITGNIGTGKSTVLTRLKQIGFKIYDLDKKFIGIGKINDNFELLPNKIFV